MIRYTKIVAAAVLGFSTLFVTSCASIVNGTEQAQVFKSSPRGARVKVDGRYYGSTPVTATLSRKSEHEVEISIPGYKPAQFVMEQKVSGWYFGNIAFGGLIGLVVDYADGAMYKLEPSPLNSVNGNHFQIDKKHAINVVFAKHLPKDRKKHKVGQLHRV